MLVQVRRPRENLGKAGYASDMGAGDGVIRFDGVQQRLERRGTKSLGAPPRAPLVNRQSAGGDTDSERPEFWHAAELSKKRTAGGYIRGMPQAARVSARGARRWNEGHPWIYRSDVVARPDIPAGAVLVEDQRGKPIGWALWSPRSEITLRMIDRDPGARIDADWWKARIAAAVERRRGVERETNAFRLVHGEGDRCPSLICDRYDRWLVVQLMSAGLEAFRAEILEAL